MLLVDVDHRRRALLLVALLALAPSGASAQTGSPAAPAPPTDQASAPAPPVELPPAPARELAVGETLGDGWELNAVDHHPEFLRYTFERGTEVTVVEVTYPRDSSAGIATESYLVQGAPGNLPEDSLLRAVAARMAALDQAGFEPNVRRTGSGSPGAGAGTGQAATDPVRSAEATRSYTAIILGILGALVLLRVAMRLRDAAKARRRSE